MAWYEKPTVLTKINKEQNYVFIDESGDIKDLSTVIKKIKNNERVEPRDSNFVVTGVYVGFKNLEYIYASMCDFKMKHFGDSKTILHASDIFNKELFICGTTTPKSLFIEELNELIDSYRYKVVATAFNKVRYIKKYGLLDETLSLSIIKALYKREFLKIEKMLIEIDREAIFVLEESSNPKIDKMILNLFVSLRKKKRLINSLKLYFTKKDAFCYPAGTELADFTSRSIYSFFRNIEFIEIAKKVYNSNLSSNEFLEFFDREVKK